MTSVHPSSCRDVLLLKVPHCVHPEAIPENDSFRLKHTFRPIPSYALAALAAFLEKHDRLGTRIQAVDINIEAYRQPGVPIDINDYPGLMEEEIRRRSYDVLCLSVMFVFNERWLRLAVELSRRYHPSARVIVGGGFPTIFPEQCLRDYDIDAVVIGEGETTLVHLLHRFNGFTDPEFAARFPFDGYGLKATDGSLEVVPKKTFIDMNDVPMGAWHYLDVEKYFRHSGERMLAVEGVRGCPRRCAFCNTQLSWGYKLRYKKVDTLIAEMQELERRYGAELHFVDDNRSVDREWMMDFLRQVLAKGMKLEPVPSSFHAHHIDEEMIALLKQAGIRTLGIAVETGSPEMQTRLKKNLNFDRVRRVVDWIKAQGLRVHINYMVGFPHETLDQIGQTLAIARELNAHSNQFLILVPYPGTAIFEEAKRDGLINFDPSNLDNFEPRRSNFLLSDEWTAAQLEEIIYDANIELNFLRNPSLDIPEQWDEFRTFCEKLLLRIPGHVAAYLVVGYLHKQKGDLSEGERFYRGAVESLRERSVNETFFRYLAWDTPVMNDFNEFRRRHGLIVEPLGDAAH